jgi:uncharacterized protein
VKIDLARLLPGMQTLEADEVFTFEDVDGSENRISCHVELNVRKADETVYIHAVAGGEYGTPCHTCLEPAVVRIESEFDIVVKRVVGAQAQPESQDGDFLYVPADAREISLDEQVYDSLIASIPIRILCKDECKGLCPGCGANLNLEVCRCEREADGKQDAPGEPDRAQEK